MWAEVIVKICRQNKYYLLKANVSELIIDILLHENYLLGELEQLVSVQLACICFPSKPLK